MIVKSLKKELTQIAHSYGSKIRFSNTTVIPCVDIFKKIIYMACFEHSTNLFISEFFHELGHVIDHKNGIYRGYYKSFPTKKYLRRFAVQAEMHADLSGEKLMQIYYPRLTFVHTYKYKSWQKWLREYWEL